MKPVGFCRQDSYDQANKMGSIIRSFNLSLAEYRAGRFEDAIPSPDSGD